MHLLRLRRHRFLFLIVWAAFFSTSSVLARTPDFVPHVQVSLFDDAHLSPGTLAQAQARASAIYSQAGIELDWLVCRQVDPTDFTPSRTLCSDLVWPTHLSVRIVPQARSVAADVFGQAFVDDSGGVYASVYYQNLVRSPNHPGLRDGDMLGYVIAHELGHLLLGTNSHSPTGLMQATWGPHILSDMPQASLIFTRAQTALLLSRFLRASKGLSTPLQAKATTRNTKVLSLCSLM